MTSDSVSSRFLKLTFASYSKPKVWILITWVENIKNQKYKNF